MAFSLQYLKKVSQTEQFDPAYNSNCGMASFRGIQLWTYDANSTGSNDSAATVEASGYFNGALGYLAVGDVIFLDSNDPAGHILRVATNNGTTVTTTATV